MLDFLTVAINFGYRQAILVVVKSFFYLNKQKLCVRSFIHSDFLGVYHIVEKCQIHVVWIR
jgi:hypothetical protein